MTRSPKSRAGSNPRDALFRNSTTEISTTSSHKRPNPRQKRREMYKNQPKFEHRKIDYAPSKTTPNLPKIEQNANTEISTTRSHKRLKPRQKRRQIYQKPNEIRTPKNRLRALTSVQNPVKNDAKSTKNLSKINVHHI